MKTTPTPPSIGAILLRALSLIVLSLFFALGLGLALGSVMAGAVALSAILAMHALVLIWQENSLLLRTGTTIQFQPHQAAQLAALEAQVRELCRRLGIASVPFVYWRTHAEQRLCGYRSLGSAGFIVVDQDLFSVWSDAEWDQELTRTLMDLTHSRSLLHSFGEWWLGLPFMKRSELTLTQQYLGVLGGWKWLLTWPVRRFFIWFQMN